MSEEAPMAMLINPDAWRFLVGDDYWPLVVAEALTAKPGERIRRRAAQLGDGFVEAR